MTSLDLARARKFFLHSVKRPSDGRHEVPCVAFVGRSNVGKSSLINALVFQRGLLGTSSKPGRTRRLAGVLVGSGLELVDTPGYGYSSRREWGQATMKFLRTRMLRRAFVLVDARHGLKPADRQILGLLEAQGVSWQMVLTKADKAPSDGMGVEVEALHHAVAGDAQILTTSAQKRQGLDALRLTILAALRA